MTQKKILLIAFLLSFAALLFGIVHRARAESGFFTNNCAGCHSVSSTCS